MQPVGSFVRAAPPSVLPDHVLVHCFAAAFTIDKKWMGRMRMQLMVRRAGVDRTTLA